MAPQSTQSVRHLTEQERKTAEAVYSEHYPRVRSLLLRHHHMQAVDADDVLQELFLAVCVALQAEALPSTPGQLKEWFDTVRVRQVSKFYEQRRRQGMTEVGKQTELTFTPEEYLNGEGVRKALPSSPSPEFLLVEQVEAKRQESRLRRLPEAVSRLPRRERVILEADLCEVERKVAAKQAHIPENQIGMCAKRGRERLWAELSQEPPEVGLSP